MFADPFATNANRKMTPSELARAIRMDIAAEQEAISLYEAHYDACPNKDAAKILKDIAEEEKIHVHELQIVLFMLDSDEAKAKDAAGSEVTKLLG
jgi:rubrerythrin